MRPSLSRGMENHDNVNKSYLGISRTCFPRPKLSRQADTPCRIPRLAGSLRAVEERQCFLRLLASDIFPRRSDTSPQRISRRLGTATKSRRSQLAAPTGWRSFLFSVIRASSRLSTIECIQINFSEASTIPILFSIQAGWMTALLITPVGTAIKA